MSDERKFSERDVILRERAAYVNGLIRGSAREFLRVADAEVAAKIAFPLPPKRVPRVELDPLRTTVGWSIREGALRVRMSAAGPWQEPDDTWGFAVRQFVPQRLALWALLFDSPWAEVPDDGSAEP